MRFIDITCISFIQCLVQDRVHIGILHRLVRLAAPRLRMWPNVARALCRQYLHVTKIETHDSLQICNSRTPRRSDTSSSEPDNDQVRDRYNRPERAAAKVSMVARSSCLSTSYDFRRQTIPTVVGVEILVYCSEQFH